MSIELIKKLIRLANNNPNDNEANLAARKVCKLIAENNFAALSSGSNKSNIGSNIGSMYEDLMRKYYKPWSWQQPSVYINECIKCGKNVKVEHKDYRMYWTCNDCKKKEEEGKKTSTAGDWDFRFSPQEDFFIGGFKVPNPFTQSAPRPEKRVRKCAKCGVEVETRRITNIFYCDSCEWEMYDHSRNT